MKMYVICDNVDTFTGLRLVGIDGRVVHLRDELKAELDSVLADEEVGILLMTEKLARQFPDIVNEIKLTRKMPLMVEIPDRHGTARPRDFIASYVREAIGVKL